MSNVLMAFRDNKENLEVLQQMRKEGWDNWLPVAELSLLKSLNSRFISKNCPFVNWLLSKS